MNPIGEFNVYWWDDKGDQYEELRFVNATTAVRRARTLTNGPAAKVGVVKRVIITDGGDCINFEWKDGEIVFGGPKHDTA